MGRLTLLLVLCVLVPAAAAAQISVDVDTTLNDPTCDELVTQLQAQASYLMFQKLTGEADAAGLDGDNDGQACESLPIAKREVLALDTAKASWLRDSTTHHIALSDSADLWIDYQYAATDTVVIGSSRVANYEYVPWRFSCGGPNIVGMGITYIDQFQERQRRALETHDERYLDYHNRADCIHMMGAIQDAP